MPGMIVHENAVIFCKHAGQVKHTSSIPRVKVSGMPVVVQPIPHVVSGCPIDRKCVIANWITAATRVTAMGQFVLLKDSQAKCTASGQGVDIVSTQERVKAT